MTILFLVIVMGGLIEFHQFTCRSIAGTKALAGEANWTVVSEAMNGNWREMVNSTWLSLKNAKWTKARNILNVNWGEVLGATRTSLKQSHWNLPTDKWVIRLWTTFLSRPWMKGFVSAMAFYVWMSLLLGRMAHLYDGR